MDGYTPIDCNYYDKIEETIVFRKEVLLEYVGEQGESIQLTTKIKDTLAVSGEEFIVLPDGEKIRMDRIVQIDGDERPGVRSC